MRERWVRFKIFNSRDFSRRWHSASPHRGNPVRNYEKQLDRGEGIPDNKLAAHLPKLKAKSE